jgi:hypothetical protein
MLEEPLSPPEDTEKVRFTVDIASVEPLHIDAVTPQLFTVAAQFMTSMWPAPLPVTVTVAVDASPPAAMVSVAPVNEPSASPQSDSVPPRVPWMWTVPERPPGPQGSEGAESALPEVPESVLLGPVELLLQAANASAAPIVIIVRVIGDLRRLSPRILPKLGFELSIWVVTHEDLRSTRRASLVFDHLVASLAAYARHA